MRFLEPVASQQVTVFQPDEPSEKTAGTSVGSCAPVLLPGRPKTCSQQVLSMGAGAIRRPLGPPGGACVHTRGPAVICQTR